MSGTGTSELSSITLRDGTRLSVTLYLPAGAGEARRVPCLLEALPYRKDDLTAAYRPEYLRLRDEHDYAVARVDLRGTGSSSGVMLDEYHPQEQADLAEVIDRLAAETWCTGGVGMFGTSWSGFNSLQMAAQRPPALRAVVASYASDDRWSDDVHYMGGALRLLDLVDYPLYMVAMNGLPPVPAVFGTGWRHEWVQRAADTPPWLLTWLEQQADGPYWRQGSVRPGPVGCPTMLITGWADGYHNVAYRLPLALDAAGTPVRVLAGPWSHAAPATSVPGPNVDHVPLTARWFDRWLRDTGPEHEAAVAAERVEPALSVFVRSWARPDPVAPVWPGRWVALEVGDLREAADVTLGAGSATVGGATVTGDVAHYEPAGDIGLAAWNSCAAALPWGQARDQSADDGRSLRLDWPSESVHGLTVVGHPRLKLRVRPDNSLALVSAKLSLVPAAGRPSLLVDRGVLNLAHRAGAVQPCLPGEWIDVEIELEAAAFEIGAQCSLRLSLACVDWPNTIGLPGTWSAVDLAATRLVLPVIDPDRFTAPDLPLPSTRFDVVDEEPMKDDESWVQWHEGHDVLAGTTWAHVDHGSAVTGDHGRQREHYTGRVETTADSSRQTLTATARYELALPDPQEPASDPVRATSEASLEVVADRENLDVRLRLDVHEGETVVAARSWHRIVPRTWT